MVKDNEKNIFANLKIFSVSCEFFFYLFSSLYHKYQISRAVELLNEKLCKHSINSNIENSNVEFRITKLKKEPLQ